MLRRKLFTSYLLSSLSSSSSSLLAVVPTFSPRHHGDAINFGVAYNNTMHTPLESAESKQIGLAIQSRERGRAYRSQQTLWPTESEMRRDVSKFNERRHRLRHPQVLLQERDHDHDENGEKRQLSSSETTAITTNQNRWVRSGKRQWGEQQDATAAATSWSAAGLDPLLADACTHLIGGGASQAQARLLPALTNSDHNDVLFGSATGSGKTTALLLAMLQGVRSETRGMNVFVASDSVSAWTAHQFVVNKMGGAAMADTGDEEAGDDVSNVADGDDHSWLYVADRREKFAMYCHTLKKNRATMRMLICTADVLCEMMFEEKFEFGQFGFLRRLYVDDISKDIRFAKDDAPMEEKRKDFTEPSASQLMLATVHQLLPPQQRALLQIGCAAADMGSELSQHLRGLCVKPTATTLIASVPRLPSTLHCVFSFPSDRHPAHSSVVERGLLRLRYLVRLLRNAAPAIPGRVVIFFPRDADLLEVQQMLREDCGLDAKLLHEVFSESRNAWLERGWRFLLLHEHQHHQSTNNSAVPLVSHVVITYVPANRFSFLHLARCAAGDRPGAPGWVFTVVPRQDATRIRELCQDELHVNVTNATVDGSLRNVPAQVVERWTAPAPLYGLDPQFVVEQRYEKFEDPLVDPTRVEMFQHPPRRRQGGGGDDDGDDLTEKHFHNRDMQLVDYTPLSVQKRRVRQIKQLQQDVMRTPEVAVDMAREGLLDADTLKPTRKLFQILDDKGNFGLVAQRDNLRAKQRGEGPRELRAAMQRMGRGISRHLGGR